MCLCKSSPAWYAHCLISLGSTRYPLTAHFTIFVQVVKAFVTLTEDYKTRDKVALAAELQAHTKAVTAPYKYPRKVGASLGSYRLRIIELGLVFTLSLCLKRNSTKLIL